MSQYEEFKPLLDRNLARAHAREVIGVASPLLARTVNHGSWALARCLQEASGKENVDTAPLSLYHQILETTDGIQELVHAGCSRATIPLLRSSFESVLALEFIVSDEERFEQRSLAWTCGHAHLRIADLELLSEKTEAGKRVRRS